jgi:hypothetical protein
LLCLSCLEQKEVAEALLIELLLTCLKVAVELLGQMSNYDQQLELLLMPFGKATSSVTVFLLQ